jgi:hypothetical protein
MVMKVARIVTIIVSFVMVVLGAQAYIVLSAESPVPPFAAGEELVFDVLYKQVRLGEATLTFHGESVLDGKGLYYVTFVTKVPGFDDMEEIYAYKDSFLPYKITRSIKRGNCFPLKITEDYDQEKHEVRIKRAGVLLTVNDTIRKPRPIYNPLLLTYYYRMQSLSSLPASYPVSIPKADFTIVLKGKQFVKTKLGGRVAYVFKGEPSKFTFWLTADEKKLPIEIRGHNLLDYSFVIKSVGTSAAQSALEGR